MLVPGSSASGEAVGLPGIVEHQRAGEALVSFGYVRNRSAHHEGQAAAARPGSRETGAVVADRLC